MLYKRKNSRFWYTKLKHRGRVIQKSTRCTNKRDATVYQEQLRKRLQCLRKQSDYTFGDAADRWLVEKQHKRSLSTDIMILNWFMARLEHTYLSGITRDKVEELRLEKRAESSTETVNRYFALLRSILRIARDDWEWIAKIPKVPMYPRQKRAPRFLSLEQFTSLAMELPPHLSAPAWFAVSTGLRTGAIQSLQWDWISRDGVRFPPEVMKNARWLTIPLSMTAWDVVAHQWNVHTGYVFVNHVGKPWAEKFTTRAWKKATIRAGLEGVVFHDLRHTFASWRLQAGVPEPIVMALGGWESREAFKIYAHFSTASLQEWV